LAVAKGGRRGEVDEIVEERGVVQGVRVRWEHECARVNRSQIVDVDPVARVVIVGEDVTTT
jgi:hypothetical protein